MNELCEQIQKVFTKRLPCRIAEVFSITVSGEQAIVKIGASSHVFTGSNFMGLIQATEFLDTLKRVHEESELLQFCKVYPRHLRYLESLTT